MSDADPEQGRGSAPADIEAGNRLPSEKDERAQSPEGNIVDWDSPADPQNPRNWPQWKKKMHIFLLGILTLNA
jgi:hypothetical protein